MISKSDSSFISSQKVSKKTDLLLKAAMEECFPHMLRFFYKDADQLFDFDREFEYMDKELLEIYPTRLKRGLVSFLGFLKQIIYITDSEINRHFDLEIHNLKGGENNMGRLWDVVSMFMREEALANARKELLGPVGDQIKLDAEIEARKGFEELRIGFLNQLKEEAKKAYEEEIRIALEEGIRASLKEQLMTALFPQKNI